MDFGPLLRNPSSLTFPSAPSDEDDHNNHHQSPSRPAPNPSSSNKKASPWHRMKWTDDVVRLLIHLVSLVGDDGCPNDPSSSSRKMRPSVLQQQQQQKKGKWKTISKLMLDNGCYVSPQQCEDKFNDLNKRYKRLNDILGRGTTCQVVENPSLLDSMPNITPKAKDDVRKILSSKHLFYREMCAYHNGQRIPNSHEQLLQLRAEDELHEEDEAEGSDYDDHDDGDDEDEEGDIKDDTFGREIDGLASTREKREWLKKRDLQLMEERVEIEAEGYKLAKRRAKWEKFKCKKDWEIERSRMENERLMLENQRMVLQLRQKEMEFDSGSAMAEVRRVH